MNSAIMTNCEFPENRSIPHVGDNMMGRGREEEPKQRNVLIGQSPDLAARDAEHRVLALGAVEEIRLLDPDGSAGLLRELVEIFCRKIEEMLQRPCWSAEPWDFVSVGRLAHSIKSSSAAVGAEKLASLCASLERRICEGEAVDVHRYHADIRSAFLEAAKALSQFLTASGS